ncbi:MAG: hypothetical protein GY782_11360, partial [Gammaproteobacteria bacterium]|nr:hypothetical protein [Gammaproteobacteria bacterium]
MNKQVNGPFRQTSRITNCAYCGLQASTFGSPWPAAKAVKATSDQAPVATDQTAPMPAPSEESASRQPETAEETPVKSPDANPTEALTHPE